MAPKSRSSSTANVFRWVLDDVVAKLRPEVLQEGVDESVLTELRSLWEEKMKARGLLADYVDAIVDAAAGASGSAVKKEDTQGSSAEPSPADSKKRKQPEGGAPQPYRSQQPTAYPGGRPSGNVIPHLDGCSDAPEAAPASAPAQPLQARRRVPQTDGPDDSGRGDDGEGGSSGLGSQDEGEEEDGEEHVGEGQGLSDEDSDEEQGALSDYLIAVFDKQSKVKGRWKINLKSGIFHIGDRDYLFNRALMDVTMYF